MIDPADLLKFTSRDHHRSYLTTPFVIGSGDFTCATNGHMAVRIPGRHTEVDQAKELPSIVKMFEDAEPMVFISFDPVNAPDATLERCDACIGFRYVIDCDVCEGTGSHECGDKRCNCEHDCGNCNGKGGTAVEWVRATINGIEHRIAKPVADELNIADGSRHDDVRMLDQIITLNGRLIRARQDRLDEMMRKL